MRILPLLGDTEITRKKSETVQEANAQLVDDLNRLGYNDRSKLPDETKNDDGCLGTEPD